MRIPSSRVRWAVAYDTSPKSPSVASKSAADENAPSSIVRHRSCVIVLAISSLMVVTR